MNRDLGKTAVLKKVEELRRNHGDVMSHRVNWNPTSWQDPSLKLFRSEISKFADNCQIEKGKHFISRSEVLSLSDSYESIFIGSMIFGYGPVGYGPSRVGKILRQNPDFSKKIEDQYLAAASSPSESWRSHRRKDRVTYLGPAFATKHAYFSSRKQKKDGIIPLIADVNTSWALWELAGIPKSVENELSYIKYVELAHQWGTQVEGANGVDEIERALFYLGQGIRAS